MNVPRLTASAAAALAIALGLAAELSAESCKLEMKRIDASSRVISTSSTDYLFRSTYPQHFYMQIREEGAAAPVVRTGDQADFSKVITKEPEEYVSKHPFRGVAKLGSQQYGFVLDTAAAPKKAEADKEAEEEKADEKAKTDEKKSGLLDIVAEAVGASKPAETKTPSVERYNRLLFDLNHNGDLTDDEPIKAMGIEGIIYPSGYASYSFPRQDLTIDVDGTKVDYSFTFRVYAHVSSNYQYASASLNAAAYRDGKITLDGKERRIVLVDFNSNGRFDDLFAIRDDVQTSDGTVYPSYGDMLFVDPKFTPNVYRSSYDPTTSDDQYYLAKLVNVDGKFYDVTVSPAGDELTLEPSKASLGKVTNPNKGYRAVVYGDLGLVKVSAGQSQEAPLPVGEWKLLAYTIDQTNTVEPEEKKPADEEAKQDKENSLLESLVGALMGGASKAVESRVARPRTTVVCARATKDYKPIEVREGETTLLPFGPPYRPLVTVGYRSGNDTVSLAMDMVGSADERCSNLMVDGGRPPKPTFTITDTKGEEVGSGSFEYG